ncbi:unnamed protein product [Blepharisma stoltei]|uniref:C2H2-type domain-containing protein n=1 Tax=Blepharisma stoltei TaxID=1481888 RepID=A0AAU9IPV6_9CILI|nr:unnamed protein product [Blepharisma stoltei]
MIKINMLDALSQRKESCQTLPSPIGLLLSDFSTPNSSICLSCNMIFQKKEDLFTHTNLFRSHEEETIFKPEIQIKPEKEDIEIPHKLKCKFCGLLLTNNKGLKQHIGKMHVTKNKNARCSQCAKRFKTKYAVRFHFNQVHARSTRVACENCGKEMYNKYVLSEHMKNCIGE